MSNETVITMPDGSKWLPSSSSDTVYCVNCGNAVDTPEEVATYPNGNCPDCGESWTGAEQKDTAITVTAPAPIGGATM